jgi:hypothetical protein
MSSTLKSTLTYDQRQFIRSYLSDKAKAEAPRRRRLERELERESERASITKGYRFCCGCQCLLDERTRGCAVCDARHEYRERVGLRFVPATCAGCGCAYDRRTIGCGSCSSRHRRRGLEGRSRLRGIQFGPSEVVFVRA